MKNPNDSLLQDWMVNCSVACANWDAFKLAQVTMKTFDISHSTHVSNQLESCTSTTSVSMRIHFNLTQLFVTSWMLICLGFLDLHGNCANCIDFTPFLGVWVIWMSILQLLAHG